ncbi:MAG: hypothetical protein Q8K96_02800 [Rubrivivax sp.]|nr:hypothetical protein [Rubrivivax sp.]
MPPGTQPNRPGADPRPGPPYRSKTLAAWLALLLGALGLHRLYLYGMRDRLAWLHPLPTALGGAGVLRMIALGQDDKLAWVLIPLLGLMISIGMLTAIVHALTPDEKWDARHNPGHAVQPTGWGAVMAAVVALMVGGAVLMGTIAFSGQRFFEWRIEGDEATPPARP